MNLNPIIQGSFNEIPAYPDSNYYLHGLETHYAEKYVLTSYKNCLISQLFFETEPPIFFAHLNAPSTLSSDHLNMKHISMRVPDRQRPVFFKTEEIAEAFFTSKEEIVSKIFSGELEECLKESLFSKINSVDESVPQKYLQLKQLDSGLTDPDLLKIITYIELKKSVWMHYFVSHPHEPFLYLRHGLYQMPRTIQVFPAPDGTPFPFIHLKRKGGKERISEHKDKKITKSVDYQRGAIVADLLFEKREDYRQELEYFRAFYEVPCTVQHQADSIYKSKCGKINKYQILMTYYNKGSLLNLWESEWDSFNPHQKAKVCLSSLLALKQVHDRGKVHGDIKFGNFLVGETFNENTLVRQLSIFIGDYGYCQSLPYDNSKNRGTIEYIPPEQYHQRRNWVSQKIDIWAMGVMLYTFYLGKFPPSTLAIKEKMKVIPPYKSNSEIPSEVDRILAKMLDLSPENRPNIDEVIEDFNKYIEIIPQ